MSDEVCGCHGDYLTLELPSSIHEDHCPQPVPDRILLMRNRLKYHHADCACKHCKVAWSERAVG